jgi:hypothetical protein
MMTTIVIPTYYSIISDRKENQQNWIVNRLVEHVEHV